MNTLKSRQLHILVIEDSAVISHMVKVVLQKEGHHVTIAETGKDALTKLAKIKYDLIFSDIHLPDMTALEIAREYRKQEMNLSIHTPIIGMSTDDAREKCIAAGMDDFMPKPFTYDQIIEAIKAFT